MAEVASAGAILRAVAMGWMLVKSEPDEKGGPVAGERQGPGESPGPWRRLLACCYFFFLTFLTLLIFDTRVAAFEPLVFFADAAGAFGVTFLSAIGISPPLIGRAPWGFAFGTSVSDYRCWRLALCVTVVTNYR